MEAILPDRQTAKRNGWTHQVQWMEQGNPCFIRCKSGGEADRSAERMTKLGCSVVVIDLTDALQLH